MVSRFRNGRIAHILLWTGLATALVLVSAPKIYRGATSYSLQGGGPLHTSDSFLRFAADASQNSAQLIATFNSLPRSRSAVIFTRKGDRQSSLLGMTIAYLAWPHPVLLTEINGRNSDAEVSRIDPASTAALVFCRVDRPEWIPPGKLAGATLEVVPLSSGDER
jgi:hypothetical protein